MAVDGSVRPAVPVPGYAGLVVLAVVLGAGFVVGPWVLAGAPGKFADEGALRATARAGFEEYWRSGQREFTPELAAVVDFWFRFHVIKAVNAGLLLLVLLGLGVLLWQRFLRSGGVVTAAGGAAGIGCALFALVLVLVNAQGAVAPFAALFPMLTGSTLEPARAPLAAGGPRPPGLDAMVADFAAYHLAMAVAAGCVAAATAALSGWLWRRCARIADRRTRLVLGAHGALTAVVAVAAIVLTVANATNVADPEAGLLALLSGGW
ncbi:hypothetical protein AB0C65_17975 [Nocardia sp. NPDC048505]|uniref:hypothetical protein n=1 Tax=Nocardia sp. NPDC048505 TaxID=3155756 RepID=UPI0033E74875